MSKTKKFKDPRGHHIRLYSEVFDSPAFKSLSPVDVMAYLALLRDLKATNNGDLSLTLAKAKERGINHHMTLARSLRALCAVGLICLTRKGGSQRGGQRLPSLYAVCDQDVYAMPQKHVEGRRADDAWRKVASVEDGHALIAAAEAAVKKTSPKLKTLGHQMTATMSPDDVITQNIRTPDDTWNGQPRHEVSYGKTSKKPVSKRVSASFLGEGDFENHRTRGVSPLHIATPEGNSCRPNGAEGKYQRLTKLVRNQGWLPAGVVCHEAASQSAMHAQTKAHTDFLESIPASAKTSGRFQHGD